MVLKTHIERDCFGALYDKALKEITMGKLRYTLIGLALCMSVVFGGGIAVGEEITGEGPNTSKSHLEILKRNGRIDRMDAHAIVVDDMLYKVTPATQWNSPKSAFKEGQVVEFMLDQNGAIASIRLRK
jgi:hypothetical protein